MDTTSAPFSLHRIKTPAIRHLAWLCEAPQLVASAINFHPSEFLAADYLNTLNHWDNNPDAAPARLRAPSENRLGHYFERLYEVMLSELMGWDLVLKNQQIRTDKQTLGELDFLLRNPVSGELEHHEIAIKYYLGVPSANGPTLWYGPNARDRLDLKTNHMLSHQSQMTQRPETRKVLAELGIHEPVKPRIFMPGYLFYPNGGDAKLPSTTPGNHLTGKWRYADNVGAEDTSRWVRLNKPHWIGPWHQTSRPHADAARDTIQWVQAEGIPALFAEMVWHAELSCWVEADRCFVVPRNWPQNHA
ncbi:DUF1853 family protein [Marinobacter litoralis]|uniref:DUF1853 family protein n=1 Tax=Marinobacter litoralis TaxID=187981 RepID=UPI0018EAA0BF|nr:DUF1853 family protein [Marinobacter litoralis]MBJ6138802.1 DUF1853 family protein [Marinobacter litoralis]